MRKIFWAIGGCIAIGLLGVVVFQQVNADRKTDGGLISTSPVLLTTSTTTDTKPSGQEERKTQTIRLANGRVLNLSLPNTYRLSVAGQGYKKLRFMAMSPDRRLFVGEMESSSDTSKGRVIVFENFDSQTGTFAASSVYLSGLRNPNSLAFYTDPSGQTWIYIALTDKLIRYPYQAGARTPAGEPQVITTFPTYARPWSQGGGHITRTLAIDQGKIYVSVGSSCNACEERLDEPLRASLLKMDPDGKNLQVIAKGLRNAVGLRVLEGELFVTDHGVDHLGNDRPEDLFYQIQEGTNYGWPYCYQSQGKIFADTTQPWTRAIDCATVPVALYGFPAHSAVLGFDRVQDQFLVALHGSGSKSLERGYKVVSLDVKTYQINDVLTGFLANGSVTGRPVDVLRYEDESFFVTDDYNGAVYSVSKND